MRCYLLFALLLVFSGLYAQYGSTYQFHFTLQDSENGFDSTTDSHKVKVKTKNRGQVLLIKTRNYTYLLSSDHHTFSADSGCITINYGAVPPFVNFNLSILRQHKRTKEWFHLELIYPKDEDFAQLQWKYDSLGIDLSYDRDPFDYSLITPKTDDGKRDLSCLLNGSCQPVWELSSQGLYKQEQARIRKFRMIKRRIDSLITTHFPNDIFERYFQEECVKAYYPGDTTYWALKCEIPIDTNLYSLMRHYKLKSPISGVELELNVHGSIDQAPYFEKWYFGNKKFMADELNFLPPTEILAFAKKEYPEVDFGKDTNGLPYVGLVYLSELPQNSYDLAGDEPPVSISDEGKKTPSWFGTFAYLMQTTLPEQGRWNGIANYYFYAQKARLIIITELYYDLTNE